MKVLEGIELKVQQILENNIDNHQSYVLHLVVHAYHSNIIQDFVCVYLRSMTQYVRSDCGMADGKEEPTIMFEDEAYSAQDLHHPRIAKNWRDPRDLH
uniref:Uncharacterized protein n=1 Tax=Brassica oleracea var. oleracea TaxID=109376 RepID=A0A0D2ZRQ2_BRAOL